MYKRMLAALVGVALATSVVMASTGSKTILVEGAPIHGGPNGVYFNGDDVLHIASVFGNGIVIMDTESGEILDKLEPEDGVNAPDDLTFGPDGSLYWTEIFLGNVGRRTPGEEVTHQFVATGVNPITFSDDGRLFVALDFLGDGLYELDPDLEDPPVQLSDTLGWLNGMDWGPDNWLYGPIWTLAKIVRIDVDEAPIVIEDVATGFGGIAAAVKFNSAGELYTVDINTGEVLRVDIGTGELEVVGVVANGMDNLAFTSDDRLFVSNFHDGSITEILPGNMTRTVSPAGLIWPAGLAIMPSAENDKLIVANLQRINEFDAVSGEELSWTRYESGYSCTVSPDGNNLLITSWLTNMVEIWDPETGEAVESFEDFLLPMNAIRFQGDIVVPLLSNGSVVCRDDATGEISTMCDGFYVPVGLAATDDDLWVSDWATGIVWQIVDDGVTLTDPILTAMGLMAPEGLAIDPDGYILVAETGAGRLSRIDPTTGIATTVVDDLELGVPGLEGLVPTHIFTGVAVGTDGVIYVSGDVQNVIYRIVVTNMAKGAGFWKHQVNANLSGKGNTAYTTAELEEFAHNIFDYFYMNEVNPIEVEGVSFVSDPDPQALTMLDLQYMLTINQNGSTMYERACRQFLAMLLNVVSDKLGLYFQASDDGASTAQAIVYIDELLESTATADHALAKDIAEMLNEGGTVGEGVIPLTTPNVIFTEGLKKIVLPASFSVSAPAPNPFNPITTIGFALPENVHVELAVYDMLGREVATLVNGWREAGVHEVTFDGSGWASGMYVYRLTAADYSSSGKMILMK